MNRAESQLTDPALFAQINQDIEQRVQVFTGDPAASNPSRVHVSEPVKTVLDVGRPQTTGLHILDGQLHTGATGYIITLDAFNDANTKGNILKEINKARAWEIVGVSFDFTCSGAVALDCWIRGTYALDGSTPNITLFQHHLTPGFALTTRGLTLPIYHPLIYTGNDFMIAAADSADADGEIKNGNLIALVAEFKNQGGTVQITVNNFFVALRLYH